jgi:hypothetical protein
MPQHYNPNNPASVGNEYAPVVGLDYTPELFLERGYSFRQTTIGTQYRWLSMFVSELPAWPVPGHGYLFTLYRRGQEANTGPMRKLIIPISSTATSGVTVVGGGGSATTALTNPTDNTYVRLGVTNGAEAYVRASFDTSATAVSAALTDKRIVNVSVLYSAFAQPGNESPLPVNVYHRRNSDAIRINMGTLDIPLSASSILTTQRHNLGELNSYEYTDGLPASPLTDINYRLPWRYAGFGLRDLRSAGDQRVEFYVAAATVEGLREVYLQYMALEVTYCEENRRGVIGFVRGADYTASCTFNPNGYWLGQNTFCGGIGMADPQNPTTVATLDTYQGTVTVKRADYGPYNNAGAPGKLRALRTLDPFPDHPGVAVQLTGAEGEIPAVTTTDLVPQIILHDVNGPAFLRSEDPSYPWGHTYGLQTPLDVYAGHSIVQEVDQYADDPNTLYTHLRFWARSLDASSPLIIERETQAQPAPSVIYTLTHEEWLTFPEIADGWRQVDLELASSAALVVDDDGTVLTPAAPRFRSDTAQFKPWQVLAERVNETPFEAANPDDTGIGTYGDEDAQGGVEGAFDTTDDTDVAVVWSVPPPEPANVAATVATQELDHVDPTCPGEISQIPTGLQYIHLTWDVVAEGGAEFAAFDHYLVRRANSVVGGGPGEVTDFYPIARLYSPLLNEFDDYEYDSGRINIYRVTVVNRNGIEGGFEFAGESIIGPKPTTINDNGGDCNALTFTSNVNPELNLAYPTSWPSAPAIKAFTFLEADERVLQRFHRRDYQVAFRPAERGGVQFTRTLLTNSAMTPEATVAKGFVPLRDTAWADLPYLCVRDQHENRWFANVNVPGGTVQNGEKLQLAEVTVTEVTGQPYPVEVHLCEGLSSSGALPGVVYDSRYAYTPSRTAFDGTDTLVATVAVRLPFFTQLVPLAARFNGTTGDGWAFYFNGADQTDGTGRLIFRANDGLNQALFTAVANYEPGDMFYARITYTATGVTSTGQIATAPDVNGAPGTFTDLAVTTVSNSPINPSFPGTPLTVGAIADGTVEFTAAPFGVDGGGAGGWTGVIREMTLEIDGVEVAAPQFDDEEPGTTEFIEGFNEWSVDGGICEAGDVT